MSNLIEMIRTQLSEEQINTLSSRLGTSPEQTQSAIQAALPTLIGALGRQAETPDGLQQIQALSSGQAGGMLDNLGGLLNMATGGGNAKGSQSMGEAILGQLLGGKRDRVQDAIGKSSGIGSSQVGDLLSMLAPMVLGAVNQKQKTSGMGSSDLGGMLRQERDSVEQSTGGSFIGRMLDQDGDGDFDMTDLFKFGMKQVMGKK